MTTRRDHLKNCDTYANLYYLHMETCKKLLHELNQIVNSFIYAEYKVTVFDEYCNEYNKNMSLVIIYQHKCINEMILIEENDYNEDILQLTSMYQKELARLYPLCTELQCISHIEDATSALTIQKEQGEYALIYYLQKKYYRFCKPQYTRPESNFIFRYGFLRVDQNISSTKYHDHNKHIQLTEIKIEQCNSQYSLHGKHMPPFQRRLYTNNASVNSLLNLHMVSHDEQFKKLLDCVRADKVPFSDFIILDDIRHIIKSLERQVYNNRKKRPIETVENNSVDVIKKARI